MEIQQTDNSLGRRDVLKKSAVIAAAAWTAPMIASSKVGASGGGTCADEDCIYYYLVKIDAVIENGKRCDDSFPNTKGFGKGSDLDCDVKFRALLRSKGISEVRTGGCANVVQVVGTPTNTLLKIKLPPGFRVKFALQKQTKGCIGECSASDPVCDSKGAPEFTFSCGVYSNMIIVVCGPDPYGLPIDAYRAITESNAVDAPPETESQRSLMVEETPSDATDTTEATTTTSSVPPVTTEATTTTSEATTTTSEATTTTSVATPEP